MGIACKSIGKMESIMKKLENQLAKEAAQAKENKMKRETVKNKKSEG